MAKEPTKSTGSAPKLTESNTPRHVLLRMGKPAGFGTKVERPATKA